MCVFLPDSPVKAKRFTDAEKVAALMRVKESQSGTQNYGLKKAQVLETFKDLRVFLICLATLLSSIPNGDISEPLKHTIDYLRLLLTVSAGFEHT